VKSIDDIRFDQEQELACVRDLLGWVTQSSHATVDKLYKGLTSDIKTLCESKAIKFSRTSRAAVPCAGFETILRILTQLKIEISAEQMISIRRIFKKPEQSVIVPPVAVTAAEGKSEILADDFAVRYDQMLQGDLTPDKRQLLTALLDLERERVQIERERIQGDRLKNDHERAMAQMKIDYELKLAQLTRGLSRQQAFETQSRRCLCEDTH